jgi:predicted small lipoprotein YifL
MKRLIAGMLVFLLVLSLAACGSGSGPASSAPPENGEKTPEQEQQEQAQQQPVEQPVQASGKGVICDGYQAFFDAKHEFIDYVVDQSEDHEIVAVKHMRERQRAGKQRTARKR